MRCLNYRILRLKIKHNDFRQKLTDTFRMHCFNIATTKVIVSTKLIKYLVQTGLTETLQ